MKTEIIKPADSKKETLWLTAVMIFILLTASILIIHQKVEKNIFLISENEISSYEKFSGIEQSLYIDLQNALVEIGEIEKETGKFPAIQKMEEEYIPPFTKDFIWKERGVDWEERFENENFYILGIRKDDSKTGNFLVKINLNNIQNSDIFYNNTLKKNDFNKNISELKKEFKKIVPYTGKDERNRWNGGI